MQRADREFTTVDEVAHKTKLRSDWKLRANFYPELQDGKKTHISAPDAKIPHSHLSKKIHLEHNAQNGCGHHIQRAEFGVHATIIHLFSACFFMSQDSSYGLCVCVCYHLVHQLQERQWPVSVCHMRVRWFPGPARKHGRV